MSYAIICPHCGELWARVEGGVTKEWKAWNGGCINCPPWPFTDSVPGSLLEVLGFDRLPLSDLQASFLIVIEHYLKEIERDTATRCEYPH